MARQVDAEADLERDAAHPLSRALGPAAHRRHRTTPSSPMTPAARATSSRRSGSATEPLSYIGWGKTTQLGYGLGLAMGAKLAHPDKLCINVWGDAAIGFTGMDFETAVRERIPIMSILLNNFSHGDRAEGDADLDREISLHRHLGRLRRDGARLRRLRRAGHRSPDEIVPAIRRGIAADRGTACPCCSSSSRARKPRCRGRGHERSELRQGKGAPAPYPVVPA